MGLAYLAPIGAQNLFVINTALTAPLGIALVTAGIVAFFDISLALACLALFWINSISLPPSSTPSSLL